MRDRLNTSYEVSQFPFFSAYIVNAKGSGCGEKAHAWSFTVDAHIYTWAPIDTKRYEGMARLAEELSEWLVNEFGLHNTTFDTVGSQIDAPAFSGESKGQGFYYVKLDVEDVTMSKGDYRSRQDIDSINVDMLNESKQHRSYSIDRCQIKPRLAPDLRMHVSETIRQLIIAGVKRAFARLAGR